MKIDRLLLIQLKEKYDTVSKVNWSTYLKLEKFLEVRTYPRNSIIKNFNEVETHSRLVWKGVVTLHHLNNKGQSITRMVFCDGDNAFDFLSYVSQKPSPSLFLARNEVTCVELRKDIEPMVLKQIPEIADLAIKINHEIISKLYHWNTEILSQPKADAYNAIMKMHKDLLICLQVKDFQHMLGIGKSTIHRLRQSG
ncbi:hypothetical protein [Cecembia rubra]|uniref:CRP-like cAMP-binding protein n=1 Tax=Cecembia rubra TaxID=1485585 RepID=A0A2P8E0S9_9BACT|nr:hypothetical protein [Cecembia rubra]PSL03084.1 CRP-like cAMP-binding protein [Cecembia rubra]